MNEPTNQKLSDVLKTVDASTEELKRHAALHRDPTQEDAKPWTNGNPTMRTSVPPVATMKPLVEDNKGLDRSMQDAMHQELSTLKAYTVHSDTTTRLLTVKDQDLGVVVEELTRQKMEIDAQLADANKAKLIVSGMLRMIEGDDHPEALVELLANSIGRKS